MARARVVFFRDGPAARRSGLLSVQCTYPKWIMRHGIHVPCGRCRACRIARAREWATRIVHERGYWSVSSFATLTYADGSLPESGSVDKAEFQRFIKRLRKGLDSRRMRYYGCGEYGEDFGRPHYHCILFGVSFEEKERVMDAWPHGHVFLGSVTYDSARYVADYVNKDTRVSGGRSRPFSLKSQGLGRKYAEEHREQLRERCGVTIGGVPVGLPRYYAKICEISGDKLREMAGPRQQELAEYYAKKYGSPELIGPALERSRLQVDRNLKARQELYAKGNL